MNSLKRTFDNADSTGRSMRTLRIAMLTAVVLMLAGVSLAHAQTTECARLGGVVDGNECVVASFVNVAGTYNLAQGLHIMPAGGLNITPAGAPLSLNIRGDLTMEIDSQIITTPAVAGNALASAITIIVLRRM